MANAISDRLSTLYPKSHMTANVPIKERGTETLGISVARKLRKKTKTTKITSTIESSSVRSVSATEARIVVVRSMTTLMSIAGEIDARSCGICA